MKPETANRPWLALWALVLGFFMILVDSTIVSVATPVLKTELNTSYNAVLWVTSAYLLAYVIPLLVTGRLGDRIGPKRTGLIGQSIVITGLATAWLLGVHNYHQVLVLGRLKPWPW